MRSTSACWVEQSRTCELNEDNLRTGYANVVYIDTWRFSPTYNTTYTERERDETNCPSEVSHVFTKINSLADATSGTYLVVDEGNNHALNASLIKTTTNTSTGLNSSTNYIDVTITNDVIEADSTTLSAALEYDATNRSLTWTDPDTTTTYTIAFSGSGTSFATSSGGNNNQTVASEVNSMFTFGSTSGTAKYIGNYNSASKFTWRISSQVTGNIALYKLN